MSKLNLFLLAFVIGYIVAAIIFGTYFHYQRHQDIRDCLDGRYSVVEGSGFVTGQNGEFVCYTTEWLELINEQ